MVDPQLGAKRTCSQCGARFYDLGKSPAVCPKCGYSFIPEVLLPSKEIQGEARKPAAEPRVVEEPAAAEEAVEVVSLEDVAEPGDDEDEVAAIENVDLGDDDVDDDSEEDAFLEDDDEEDSDVTGLIGGGLAGDDEEP